MKMNLDIYTHTGGERFSRATWRKIALAIRAASEQGALSRAVALAIGCTRHEASHTERLEKLQCSTLAWLLAAALARDSASPLAKSRRRRAKKKR